MDPTLRNKSRLISEEELPSWLLRDEEEVTCYLDNDIHESVLLAL